MAHEHNKTRHFQWRKLFLERHQFDSKDAEILEAMQDFPDATDVQIGRLVGLKRQAVNARRNSNKFKARLAELSEKPVERLRKALPKLAEHYLKLALSALSDHSVQERATSKILTTFSILLADPPPVAGPKIDVKVIELSSGRQLGIETKVGSEPNET